MNCPNCGTPLTPGSAFCTNCGVPLSPQPAAQPQQTYSPPAPVPQQPVHQPNAPQQPMQQPYAPQGQPRRQMPYGQAPYRQPQPPKKKNKAGLIVLIIVLVLAVVTGGIVFAVHTLRHSVMGPDVPTETDPTSQVLTTQGTAQKTDDFDAATHIIGAADFANSLVNYDSFDHSKSYTEMISGEYGDYEVEMYRYDIYDVKTMADLKRVGAEYYTEQAIDEYFAQDYAGYKETDDGLYLYVDGIGDASSHIYTLYEQTGKTEYTVTEYWFAGPYADTVDFSMTYNKDMDTWQFDTMLPFFMAYADVFEKNTQVGEQVHVAAAYARVLQTYDENHSNEAYAVYGLFDIDGNGVEELIVETGDYESERRRYYYGYSNGDSILLGSENAANSFIGSYDGTLVTEYVQNDAYRYYEYLMHDDYVTSRENPEINSNAIKWLQELGYWDTEYLHETLVTNQGQ